MLKLPSETKKIISSKLDQKLIKTRQVKNADLQYISGVTVSDILNKAFNYNWDWVTEREWIQESAPYFNTYSKSPNKIYYNGKEGVWEEQGPIAHVRGVLTVYYEDDGKIYTIKKTGYGSKAIIGKQSEQDSIFKAADTDALKKAASRLGIGAELYRSEEEDDFFTQMQNEDLWDEESKKEYEAERTFIKNIINEYNLTDSDLAGLVNEYDSNLYSYNYIIPDNIKGFVEFCKTKIPAEDVAKFTNVN